MKANELKAGDNVIFRTGSNHAVNCGRFVELSPSGRFALIAGPVDSASVYRVDEITVEEVWPKKETVKAKPEGTGNISNLPLDQSGTAAAEFDPAAAGAPIST